MSQRLRMSPNDDGPPSANTADGDLAASTADAGGEPDLTARALQGDAAAWAGLIERHSHKVVVALLARGLRLDEAREVAQETWLRLIEQQRAGRLQALSLPGLAIVQAGFLLSNQRRRERVAARSDERSVMPSDHARTAEQDAMGRQRLSVLARALRDCPPSSRRVFELVYDRPELGYADVASRVGLSVQRVKQIVFEVRKRLRAALEEQDA